MTTKNKAIYWSKFPRSAYAVSYNGTLIGIGTNPIFEVVPGAWNILSLLWGEVMDSLLPYSGDPGRFPYDCAIVPFAAGTALQKYDDTRTVGELADSCTPEEFIQLLSEFEHKDQLIMVNAFKESFWDAAKRFVSRWVYPVSGNVIRGNFGRAKVQ